MRIKKEFSVFIVLILFIVFIDIILNDHFEKEKNSLDELVNELQGIIYNNQDGKNKMKKLDEKWTKFEKIAAIYTEHDELEKISLKIALVKKNIEIDENDMTLEYLEEVKFYLKHILEKDKVKLKNIF